MLDRLQSQDLAAPWKDGDDVVVGNGSSDNNDKARRFRDAALPHLDDVYTLARYLLHNGADADDAVQECYLRALRHFRYLSRAGDKTVAFCHPAEHLPWRIRAPIARGTHNGR